MDKLYFDLETTSADQATARIVELAIIIVDEKGKTVLSKSKRYNPNIPITAEATAVHGITDSDVLGEPPFRDDARKLKKLFEGKIIIGFNCMIFDIPILLNEFDRAGVEVDLSGKIIDVFRIEKKLNSQNLAAVYKKYTGEDLEGAHDSLNDIKATRRILECQISENEIKTMTDLYELSGTDKLVDLYGKFHRDEQGFLIVNFGKKCKGQRLIDDPGFADWMLGQSFPSTIKKMVREEMLKKTAKEFKHPMPHSKILDFTQVKGFHPHIDENPIEPPIDDLPF